MVGVKHRSSNPPDPPRRSRPRFRKRWLVLAAPVIVFAGLVALAPSTPDRSEDEPATTPAGQRQQDDKPFRYVPDDEVYALNLDPREVRFDLLEGWDREQDAFEDLAALAYVSGPMYERHIDNAGQEITVPLGDLKFGARVWRGRNRTASRQRAFIGIRHDGSVDFGYGELTEERSRTYDTFIGGLHSLYNDLEEPPETYKGAYSKSMGQRIRYYLPRIRMVMGLRDDGRLEVLMSRDGLTLEQTKELARRRSYLAAYMPDHASKSRFIIPGVKGLTENQWESIFSKADKNMVEFGTQSGWTSWAKKLTEEDKDELITYLVQGAASDGHIDSSEVAFILVISQTIGHDGMDVLAYMEQNYGLDKAEVDLAFSRLETMMKAAGLG